MSLKVEVFPKIGIELRYDLEPTVGELRFLSGDRQVDKARTCFESAEYMVEAVQIWKTRNDVHLSFSVKRKRGDEFKVKGYEVNCLIPIVDFEKVFSPTGRLSRGVSERFKWYTSANMFIPFVICTNRYGMNKFSVGFEGQVLETEISGGIHSVKGLYHLRLKRPVDGIALTRRILKDALLFSAQQVDWFDVVDGYCTRIGRAQRSTKHIPEVYYEPQWNSWYPFLFDIDEKTIWENTQICKDLGLKMISIDAGWSDNSTDEWGDWVPLPQKFPDLKRLMSRIQKEGLLVELFYAPFWVGSSTRAFKKLTDIRIVTEAGESPNLCPRNSLTERHVSEVTSRITREFQPDAVLVDLTVAIPMLSCKADHEHVYESIGEGYNECLRVICESVLREKPDAMIEACDTTNLNSRRFFLVTYDSEPEVPFEIHQRYMVLMRSASRGLVPKNTPYPWHKDESEKNVSKYMAQQIMLGVPSLTGDLRELSESHIQILKAWLNFYRGNREQLFSGRFRPIGFFDLSFPHVKIEGRDRAYIQLGYTGIPAITLTKRYQKAYIMNTSESQSLFFILEGLRNGKYKAQIYDHFLEPIMENTISSYGKCYVDLNVPEGGLVCLERA